MCVCARALINKRGNNVCHMSVCQHECVSICVCVIASHTVCQCESVCVQYYIYLMLILSVYTLFCIMRSTMFVLFLIYPVVSIATMRAFNCDANLGLLKDDYHVTCPPVISFLTYFQILGSFTMFTIQWPPIAYTMIVWFKQNFKFELLQMPGLSCVLAGYSSFENTLFMYTIGPLIFIVALALPMLAAIVRGYRASGSYRWRHSQDKFWTKCVLLCVCVCVCVCVRARFDQQARQ